MKKIDSVYTGNTAATYDAKRASGKRWQREAAVIEPILRRLPIASSLVDIAAGTGRWLDIYSDRQLSVTLLDSSKDMLNQAISKAQNLDFAVETIC